MSDIIRHLCNAYNVICIYIFIHTCMYIYDIYIYIYILYFIISYYIIIYVAFHVPAAQGDGSRRVEVGTAPP